MDQCHLMVYSDHGSKEIVFKNSNDLILAAQEQSKQGDEVLFEEKSTSIAATICEKMYARAVQLFVVYWCTSTSSMMKWMSPIEVLSSETKIAQELLPLKEEYQSHRIVYGMQRERQD
eukprot:1000044_1